MFVFYFICFLDNKGRGDVFISYNLFLSSVFDIFYLNIIYLSIVYDD